MGIDVDGTLSPELLRQVTYLGTVLSSFPQAEAALGHLLGVPVGRKLIERTTERIGAERVGGRDTDRECHELRTLMVLTAGPARVTPPVVGAVMADGGRFQRTQKNADATSHWGEYKAGLCLTLAEQTDETPLGEDPHPAVPDFLLSAECVRTLTTEIARKAADVPETTDATDPAVESASGTVGDTAPDNREPPVLSPKVTAREVVATTRDASAFSAMLYARAWESGLFQSDREAFVGDGSSWIWTIWSKRFKAWKFVPILDVIHAVTHIYAAAMAGRTLSEGWPIYEQWISWIWNSQVERVIAAVRERAAELGEPTDDDGPTSIRGIVWATLGYLENQQPRMDYANYLRAGLPITSSHMESAVKELNHRIKGSEKFWSESGGESVLQLKADELSTSVPLESFWNSRPKTRTGLRSRCRKPTPA